MLKIVLLFCLFFINSYASEGSWFMLGASSDATSSSLQRDGESIYTYEANGTWNEYNSTNIGTIKAGSGFWLKSNETSRTITMNTSTIQKNLTLGWNFVSPVKDSWNIQNDFPNIDFGWRYTNGDWQLYNQQNKDYGFVSFNTISLGEGVWLNVDYSGKIGNYSVLIQNGIFDEFSKNYTVSEVQEAFLDDVKNLFDLSFYTDITKSNLSDFVIGLKLTRVATNSVYYYFITVATTSNNPYVELQKTNGSLGTSNIDKPIEISNNTIKLNFHKIVKYLIDSDYYTLKEMQDRFGMKSAYKMEVYGRNLEIIGGKKLTQDELLNGTKNFSNTNSKKIEGTLIIK